MIFLDVGIRKKEQTGLHVKCLVWVTEKMRRMVFAYGFQCGPA